MKKALSVLLLGVLFVPFVSFGATQDTQSLIASITSQIQALQAQLSALQGVQSTPQKGDLSVKLTKHSVKLLHSKTLPKGQDGTYRLAFEVTALDNPVYIPLSAGNGKSDGINYLVNGPNPAVLTSSVTCSGKSVTGTSSGGVFYCYIPEGKTATFKFEATHAELEGSYFLDIGSITYKVNPTDKSLKTYHPTDLKTDVINFTRKNK